MKTKRYANVSWTPDDVLTLFDISREEAEDWLIQNEQHIQEALVQRGWDVLEELGVSDGLPLSDLE